LTQTTHAKDVNDWLQAGSQSDHDPLDLMCECGAVGCRAVVYTTRGTYLSVRGLDGGLLIAADHVNAAEFQVLETLGDVLVAVPRTAPAEAA
jgi:hypothetical protein